MPWTPDEAKAIRQDKNHPHYWDVPHDPQGLPVNTPDEKENPNPEYLHRGIRVKGPVGRSQIQQILRNGIGQHFTSDIHNAAAFGDPSNHDEGDDYPGAAHYPGPKNVGLVFTIKHPGQQHIAVNPDGESVNADYWDDEHEHTLSPGAPVQVTHIHMKDSGGDWRPLTLPIDTRGHTAARTAMPAPAPEGLNFKVHPDSDSFSKANWDYPFTVNNYPVITAHDPKFMSGIPAIGHLEWFQEPTEADKDSLMWDMRREGEPGEVSFINVRPEYRRHNVATTMFDWVKGNLEPRLHHSDERSELGRQWIEHERTRTAPRLAGANGDLPEGLELTSKQYRNGESSWHAHHNGQQVGELWVMPSDYGDQGQIANIDVHEDYHRRGVGKALWEAAGRPLHTPSQQTAQGRAWAQSVGGGSDHTAAFDPAKIDDFDPEHGGMSSTPKNLKSPLYDENTRLKLPNLTDYMDSEGPQYYFSPREINPEPNTSARPATPWYQTSTDDPIIPGMGMGLAHNEGEEWEYGNERQPYDLHRGFKLWLPDHDSDSSIAQARRLIHGPELENSNQYNRDHFPGSYSDRELTKEPKGFDHPDLPHHILDHILNSHDQQELGTHWSTDLETAGKFAGVYPAKSMYLPQSLPVVVSGQWKGVGEDPYRRHAGGDYSDEHEITLLPGAPMKIHTVRIHNPYTNAWHTHTLDEPQERTAAVDDEEENEEEEDGNYCSSCGPDDPDWCEECEECKSCDNHENHCDSCGPNDSDWCDSCELCKLCDSHDNHCDSCGPNDSDWCEECEACKHCDWHDDHCSYCGPNDSDWCEYHGECKSCSDHSDNDAFPLHLKTPLMRANERPQVYNYSTGEHEYYFSPKEFNPASEAESRPYMDFPDPEDEDPTLDFGKPLRQTNGIDNIPAGTPGAELYRGLTVNLKHPDLAELRRAIHGPEMESYYSGDPSSYAPGHQERRYGPKRPIQPGMFPGPYSDKELTAPPANPDHLHRHLDALLDHMENSQKETGLGRHWSTDFGQAMGFVNTHGPYAHQNGRLPVRMKALWKGQGENPYRHETGEDMPGGYAEEREMNLLPGAPVELHDVEIFHPQTKQWHSLMDKPQVRTAGLFL
jgi:GNAT superfamily N-acetyltransferase